MRRDKKIRKARARIGKLHNQNMIIKQEFDSLKDVAEKWLNERITLYERIKELENKLKTLKEDSNFHAAHLEGQIEKLQKEYDELKLNQMRDRLKFQEDIAQEIKIHEAMA